MNDIAHKLRALRRSRLMKQGGLAKASGVGVKTISSFETGERIDSLKVSQLRKILDVYNLTLGDFFSKSATRLAHEGEREWLKER
jgi:transcriptional regulator with XRE-family HTH domain